MRPLCCSGALLTTSARITAPSGRVIETPSALGLTADGESEQLEKPAATTRNTATKVATVCSPSLTGIDLMTAADEAPF